MIYLLGLIILESFADIFAKKYGMEQRSLWFICAIGSYVAANTSWLIYMSKLNNLTIGANIFSVASGLLAAFIGIGFYGEIVDTKHIIGIVLGMVSLWLLLS
jgi:uncharacterized membrane protein